MADFCHCGQPLHYRSAEMKRIMDEMVTNLGEYVKVTTPQGSWMVQRHYIALHGLSAPALPTLGFAKA